MLEKKEELDYIPFLRRAQGKRTLCQLITLVRNFDWTVGAEQEDFLSPMCPSIIGLSDTPAIYQGRHLSQHCLGQNQSGRPEI